MYINSSIIRKTFSENITNHIPSLIQFEQIKSFSLFLNRKKIKQLRDGKKKTFEKSENNLLKK